MIDRQSAKTLLAVVGTAALLGGCDVGSVATGETRNETVTFDLDDSKSVRVELSMGSGELRVASGTSKLMEGKFSYNVPDWKPVVDYRAGGTSTGELKLSQPTSSGSGFGNSVNNWDVKLNDEPALDVTANLGAGEANLDLGKMNLNRVEMGIGAGKWIWIYAASRSAITRCKFAVASARRSSTCRKTSASPRRRPKASAISASKDSSSATVYG